MPLPCCESLCRDDEAACAGCQNCGVAAICQINNLTGQCAVNLRINSCAGAVCECHGNRVVAGNSSGIIRQNRHPPRRAHGTFQNGRAEEGESQRSEATGL